MDLICKNVQSLTCFDDHVEYQYRFDKCFEIVRFMDENNINLIPSRVKIVDTIHERYISPDNELLKSVIERYHSEVDNLFNEVIKEFSDPIYKIYLGSGEYEFYINNNETYLSIKFNLAYLENPIYPLELYENFDYSKFAFDRAAKIVLYDIAEKYKSLEIFDYKSKLLLPHYVYEGIALFNLKLPK